MPSINRSPARTSSLLAVITGGIAVLSMLNPLAIAIGTIGIILLAIGLIYGRRKTITSGAFMMFIGMLIAGILDTPPELLLVGMTAIVLAWDTGEQAINIGEQLGRNAATHRVELAHFANSTLVGAIAILAGYVVFRIASGGQPIAALALLLLAAVVLASVLRE